MNARTKARFMPSGIDLSDEPDSVRVSVARGAFRTLQPELRGHQHMGAVHMRPPGHHVLRPAQRSGNPEADIHRLQPNSPALHLPHCLRICITELHRRGSVVVMRAMRLVK